MPVTDAAFDDPWRVRCPHGHTGLRPLDEGDMAYCQRCRWSYPYEKLVDQRDEQVGRVSE